MDGGERRAAVYVSTKLPIELVLWQARHGRAVQPRYAPCGRLNCTIQVRNAAPQRSFYYHLRDHNLRVLVPHLRAHLESGREFCGSEDPTAGRSYSLASLAGWAREFIVRVLLRRHRRTAGLLGVFELDTTDMDIDASVGFPA